MQRLLFVLAILVVGFCAAKAEAQDLTDRVRLLRGSESGEVTKMTPLEVTIENRSGERREFAVNQVRSIRFDEEPTELTQARLSVDNGGYLNARELLQRIDLTTVEREFVKQDIEFYLALCEAKLSLTGDGDITLAGRQLNTFVRSHPHNYHYLHAAEVMGDLLVAAKKYSSAEKQYAELSKAPWPEFKMRASILVARTLQDQGKHDEAIEKFEAVLRLSSEDDEEARSQQLAATLGKAVSMAQTERVDEAVRLIEDVITEADPEEKELHARAYNALGTSYEKAGQTKDALLAFLHVDVLYSNVPEAHAEALSHLAALWQAVGQEGRAREARQMLKDRYAGSRWAQ